MVGQVWEKRAQFIEELLKIKHGKAMAKEEITVSLDSRGEYALKRVPLPKEKMTAKRLIRSFSANSILRKILFPLIFIKRKLGIKLY